MNAATQEQFSFGATVRETGVDFVVWAPHAEKVAVSGTFNGWSATDNPLSRDDQGNWSGHVATAKVGDEYKYEIFYQGEQLSRLDPYSRALTSSKGNSLIIDPRFDWEEDDFKPAPLEELVLYELHIGTFCQRNGHGTFASAIERLPHLRSLGINGITLMPITEFVGKRGWGYDMAHLYAVEESYGGPHAFKEFVKAAHSEGIAVMLDIVFNHLGFEDNSLWRFDGWHEGDRGGIYFFQDDERAETPWGPRPDFGRPEVRRYILDNVRMWLGEYRLDGLRVDGTYHMRTPSKTETSSYAPLPEGWSLLREMTAMVRAEFPTKYIIAEDMREEPLMVQNATEGGAGFHAQWSDRIGHAARMPARSRSEETAIMRTFREILEARYTDDTIQRVIFSESHDNAGKDGRIPEVANPQDAESDESIRRTLLAAAVMFTAPGVPQIFQGQEVLDTRYFDIWNPPPLDLSRIEKFPGVFQFFCDMIALRRNTAGLTAGLTGRHVNVFHQDDEAAVLAWYRSKQGGVGDDVLVIANFSKRLHASHEITPPVEGDWRLVFDSGRPEYDLPAIRVPARISSAETPVRGGSFDVMLRPRAVLIYARES
jgi:1,4-alpha-glucan branching enzyme